MHQENYTAAQRAQGTESAQGAELIQNSGALPGDSPYYNRLFWASFKGQSRGIWGGILLGAALGALGGAAIALALPVFGVAGVGVGVLSAVGSMVGMVYAKEVFGLSGAVAGAVAAGMEVSEERRHREELARAQGLDLVTGQTVGVVSPQAQAAMSEYRKISGMSSGEIPYEGDETKRLFGSKHHDPGERPLYFGMVGLAGAAVGALFGGITYLGADSVVSGLMEHFSVGKGAAAAMMVGGGAFTGATYGINRHYFREMFNVSNALYDGHLSEIGKQHAQEVGLVVPPPIISKIPPLPERGVGAAKAVMSNGVQPNPRINTVALVERQQQPVLEPPVQRPI